MICIPSLVFLIIGVINLFLMVIHKFNRSDSFMYIVYVSIGTYFLNFLCKKGYIIISWIIITLQIIFLIFSIFYILHIITDIGNIDENIGKLYYKNI